MSPAKLSTGLHHLKQSPALLFRQRPCLHNQDFVAHLRLIFLVMNLEFICLSYNLFIKGVHSAAGDPDNDGLIHLVANYLAYPCFSFACSFFFEHNNSFFIVKILAIALLAFLTSEGFSSLPPAA